MTCRHVEQVDGANYVTGCEAGVDLTDPDEPQRVVPRGMCPLWEARP
jgi:hypothetical protein